MSLHAHQDEAACGDFQVEPSTCMECFYEQVQDPADKSFDRWMSKLLYPEQHYDLRGGQ